MLSCAKHGTMDIVFSEAKRLKVIASLISIVLHWADIYFLVFSSINTPDRLTLIWECLGSIDAELRAKLYKFCC